MAFILGIYEELITSIRAVDSQLVRKVLRLHIREALSTFPWQFLLSVGIGVGLAILTLAQFLENQLELHPNRVWAFFFGLVLASVVIVSRAVSRWRAATFGAAIAAAIGGYVLVGAVPVQTPEAPWFLFLSGAIAICAMILPGISGAFILVLLGKYQYVLAAVNNRDILTVGLVGLGAGFGIVTFARALNWLFIHHRDVTVAALTGLMIGSLRKVWPWKETLQTTIDRHGEIVPLVQANILPAALDGEVWFSIGLLTLGIVAVLLLTWAAGRRRPAAEAALTG